MLADDPNDEDAKRMVAKYEKELAGLQNGNNESLGQFGSADVTEEEVAKAGSKFAAAGLHLSEFGMPYWKTPGASVAFPFTIIDGIDTGKESEIVAGIGKSGIWKLKEIVTACGCEMLYNSDGKLDLDKTLAPVYGKRAKVLWTVQKDTRSVEEGGKGTTYTKPVQVLSVDAEPPAELL